MAVSSSSLPGATRFWLRSHIERHPGLFRLAYRLARRPADVLVAPDSDILIEGFPRSANSYAVWAFRLSNPQARIAHHVHSPAHVLLALRYGVPAVVLLRQPDAAIRSRLVRQPGLRTAFALRSYTAFYEAILPHADELTVVRFETAVERFENVIAAVNARHGTGFKDPASAGVDSDAVMAAIDAHNKSGHGGRINARFVPRPHPERERLKASLSLAEHEHALQRAQLVHDRLLAAAV